jgi:hypothetical protein
MYKIEKRPSGYILTFSGVINATEMQNWYNDTQDVLSTETLTSFGVIIDMHDLMPISQETQGIMVAGQGLFKQKGMKRSAVILASAAISMQFKKIAQQSGIFVSERYIDASCIANPIDVAIKWVKDAIDPDL